MNAPAPVRVAAITKTYRLAADVTITALDTMDLAVDAGEVLAVQGTSGSGKSTLLHLIGAMEPSDTGQIEVGRTVVTELDDRGRTVYRRSIGFVFQHLHLLPAPTLLDNVLAPVIPYQPDGDTTTRALGLLDAVVLADRASSTPGRLSGGQQQRVAIARALINSPRLILADEPTGALDETTGGVIVDLLLRVREQHDTSVIVATHDPSVAARCDRIVDLRDDGSVEQDG